MQVHTHTHTHTQEHLRLADQGYYSNHHYLSLLPENNYNNKGPPPPPPSSSSSGCQSSGRVLAAAVIIMMHSLTSGFNKQVCVAAVLGLPPFLLHSWISGSHWLGTRLVVHTWTYSATLDVLCIIPTSSLLRKSHSFLLCLSKHLSHSNFN